MSDQPRRDSDDRRGADDSPISPNAPPPPVVPPPPPSEKARPPAGSQHGTRRNEPHRPAHRRPEVDRIKTYRQEEEHDEVAVRDHTDVAKRTSGDVSEYEAALSRALDRADQAMNMVGKMEMQLQRSDHRHSIEKTITHKQDDRKTLKRSLIGLFYVNFVVLGIIYLFGGGFAYGNAGEVLLSFARLCGLTSSYLLCVQLLLVGRIPALDRVYGIDKLTRWHRLNGTVSFGLAIAHAYFAVMGRSLSTQSSLGFVWQGVISIDWMIHAILGTLLMFAAIATSVKNAHRKIGYNKWLFVHLWTYLGVALTFGHQIFGPDTEGRPGAQAYFIFLYIATFGLIFWTRIATPILRTFRHQLRVAKIVEEGPGVNSIYMTGFHLEGLLAKPGQFCWWRFLTKQDWLEPHPFSLSTAPNSDYVRITVKSLGDFSSRIAEIPIGTWVTFEGPFGGFTADNRVTTRTVLVAGGVGITPIRSLLEGIPAAAGDITVIYRADKINDAVLLQELEELASQRQAILHVVLGKRADYPKDRQPLSADHLRSLVPDINDRDVYICAAPGLTAGMVKTLKSMGLPKSQVHHESF